MRLLVPGLVAALLVAAACSSNRGARAQSDPARLSIVATTTQVADFAAVVGGDHVTVYDVLGANVDPHDFEPSPVDLNAIADAKVIVENGLGLEAWFDETIASAEPQGTIVDASGGVAARPGTDTGGRDPHIWFDPRNATIMATNIERALSAADPDHAADYERNLGTYRAQLADLDAEITHQLASLPNRHVVTNHDAFGYYLARYGLEFVGAIIPSVDTSAELSAAQIADIVERIRQTGTKAVFSESSLPPKTAEAIGREAGVRVVAGEDALYGDSLGPAGSDGDTYLEMMRHNTKVFVDNLR